MKRLLKCGRAARCVDRFTSFKAAFFAERTFFRMTALRAAQIFFVVLPCKRPITVFQGVLPRIVGGSVFDRVTMVDADVLGVRDDAHQELIIPGLEEVAPAYRITMTKTAYEASYKEPHHLEVNKSIADVVTFTSTQRPREAHIACAQDLILRESDFQGATIRFQPSMLFSPAMAIATHISSASMAVGTFFLPGKQPTLRMLFPREAEWTWETLNSIKRFSDQIRDVIPDNKPPSIRTRSTSTHSDASSCAISDSNFTARDTTVFIVPFKTPVITDGIVAAFKKFFALNPTQVQATFVQFRVGQDHQLLQLAKKNALIHGGAFMVSTSLREF